MSVDKFGRFSSSNTISQGVRGAKGEGFNLTRAGDYDIKFKRICNVGAPTEIGDAVNLDTLKVSVSKCLSVNEENIYNAKGARISNLDVPIYDSDAINKLYLTSNTPVKLPDSYSFHQYRIQDVATPIANGDAVNYITFNNKAMIINRGNFSAKGLKITNVHDPKVGQDAVNMRYLQGNTLFLKANKECDAKGHAIKNLALPTSVGDAVNYAYLSDVVAEMSYTLHKILKKGTQKLTKEEWKKKVTKSLHTCDWGDLFGTSENALLQPVNDAPASALLNTADANALSH